MASTLHDTVERAFAAVMAKDLNAVLGFFADDGMLIDPHYPTPHMAGKAAIADGLSWAFGNMEKMGFTIANYFEAADGKSAAIEVDTAHRLRGGMKLSFRQVFVIETRDGLSPVCKPMSHMGRTASADSSSRSRD